jgi:hypothetical protein
MRLTAEKTVFRTPVQRGKIAGAQRERARGLNFLGFFFFESEGG